MASPDDLPVASMMPALRAAVVTLQQSFSLCDPGPHVTVIRKPVLQCRDHFPKGQTRRQHCFGSKSCREVTCYRHRWHQQPDSNIGGRSIQPSGRFPKEITRRSPACVPVANVQLLTPTSGGVLPVANLHHLFHHGARMVPTRSVRVVAETRQEAGLIPSGSRRPRADLRQTLSEFVAPVTASGITRDFTIE
jgi:hypothetical protein